MQYWYIYLYLASLGLIVGGLEFQELSIFIVGGGLIIPASVAWVAAAVSNAAFKGNSERTSVIKGRLPPRR